MPRKQRAHKDVEPRDCENCGARMTTAGRRSKLGLHYCSKPECVRAKQRALYRSRSDGSLRTDASQECACCEAKLPPRKERFGDSPLGRWCRRARCQRHRRLVLEQAGTGKLSEKEQLTIDFSDAISDLKNRVLCSECGLADAVPGFIHPVLIDGSLTKCETVGTKNAPMSLARLTWPDRFPKTEFF